MLRTQILYGFHDDILKHFPLFYCFPGREHIKPAHNTYQLAFTAEDRPSLPRELHSRGLICKHSRQCLIQCPPPLWEHGPSSLPVQLPQLTLPTFDTSLPSSSQ